MFDVKTKHNDELTEDQIAQFKLFMQLAEDIRRNNDLTEKCGKNFFRSLPVFFMCLIGVAAGLCLLQPKIKKLQQPWDHLTNISIITFATLPFCCLYMSCLIYALKHSSRRIV